MTIQNRLQKNIEDINKTSYANRDSSSPSIVDTKKLKNYIKSSQLSLLQVVVEWIEGNDNRYEMTVQDIANHLQEIIKENK